MLKQANAVKIITASGGGTLEADTGESFLIKRIECVPSANDTYLTLRVDKVTVGFYRVKGRSGNHLGSLVKGERRRNIMEWLNLHGINVTIPVAEGQVFSVSRYNEAGTVIVIYDIYDAGDIKATMENGSDARTYTFLQYLDVGTGLTDAGDALCDVSLSPAEFPAFPAGAPVPSKTEIEVLGIVGSPFVMGKSGPASFGSKFLKLIKDREVLFDEDRNGIPFNGEDATATSAAYNCNYSLIGPYVSVLEDSATVVDGEPLLFDPPLRFTSGDELNIYINCSETGTATWASDVVDLATILRVRKM